MAAPPKTGNRRRAGHKSCEACKVLKARCVRADENEPCRRCKRKGEECIIPEWRRPPPRTGTRIELARTLFGELDEQSTSDDDSMDGDDEQSEAKIEDDPFVTADKSYSPTLALSPSSTQSALYRDEAWCWVSSHLVEEYFVSSMYPLPLGRWRDFRAEFEQAGRRPDQLNSPTAEVLALVLMAHGALVTNAPCVLGSDTPIYAQNAVNQQLTYWGERRALVCRELAEKAVRLADEKSVFRRESADSITVLLVLSNILDHGDTQRRRGRPYRMAAHAHARTIAEERYPERDYRDLVGGALGWMVYLDDTWTSASAGTIPLLNDDDLRLMYPSLVEECTLPDMSVTSRALNGESNTWNPVRRIWLFIANLTRQLIPYLRQRPDDSELLVIAANGLDESSTVLGAAYAQLEEHKKTSSTLQALLSKFVTFRRPGYGLLRYYVVLSPLGRMIVVFYIDRAIKKWIERLSREPGQPDFRWTALSKLQTESESRMFACAREFARLFHALLDFLPSPTSMALASGMSIVYEMLPTWADSLSAIPVQEDGCSTTYTLQQKHEEVFWFLEGLYAFSGVYADGIIREAVATTERTLAHLEARLQLSMPC